MNLFEIFLVDIKTFNDRKWWCCEKCIVLISLHNLTALQVAPCPPPPPLISVMLYSALV